ncbi:MAG: Phosphoenolpyruvate-protein phosphotransferase of PTS system [Ignavibacteriae bacterium]|nr:MAG: Phosphoenolpyruvate-protein phosphotransferase of PTS system [Ignavibacteriota bacterium]
MIEDKHKPEIIFRGIPASPGISIGKVFLYVKEIPTAVERIIKPDEVENEIQKLRNAVKKSEKELLKILSFAQQKIGEGKSKILEAQIMILRDQFLLESLEKRIKTELRNAEYIVSDEIGKYEKMMLMAQDDYMHERAHDVDDLKNRIIRNMQQTKLISKFEEAAIVVAHSLTPADTVIFSRNTVLGYATDRGGITSHAAILSRALKIPAVLGLGDISRRVSHGDKIIIDGYSGIVIVNPSLEQQSKYQAKKEKYLQHEAKLVQIKNLPAVTLDNHKIELSANIEFEEEIEYVQMQGSQGVGLFRSESILINKESIPTEEEQYQVYKLFAERIYPNRIIIRTFDVGGDKIAPNTIEEANPFLGWRGIRIFLDHKDLFLEQLRAILRASTRKNIAIMFPMVSTVEEIIKAKEILEIAKSQLKSKKIKFDSNIKIGAMIEVPSAAVTADTIAKEVDFLSIGTNDLTQYLLAVDRGNNVVSGLYQEFHPSVIRTIKYIIDAGHKENKWVGMCGELAGNPLATVLLVGLGLDEFSVIPTILPEIKRIIRSIKYSDAKLLASEVLNLATTDEVLKFLRSYLQKNFKDIIINNNNK